MRIDWHFANFSSVSKYLYSRNFPASNFSCVTRANKKLILISRWLYTVKRGYFIHISVVFWSKNFVRPVEHFFYGYWMTLSLSARLCNARSGKVETVNGERDLYSHGVVVILGRRSLHKTTWRICCRKYRYKHGMCRVCLCICLCINTKAGSALLKQNIHTLPMILSGFFNRDFAESTSKPLKTQQNMV